MAEYAGRFRVALPDKSMLTDAEWASLWAFLATDTVYQGARAFVELSFCTGLRPSEVVRFSPDDLDRDGSRYRVLVTKTRGRAVYRWIAVPSRLIAFVANAGIPSFQGIRHEWDAVRHLAGVPTVTLKTFRKDFAHRLETAGAEPYLINLHQGREQSGVLHQHYLTDPMRAVRLCRPFISVMFGDAPCETRKPTVKNASI